MSNNLKAGEVKSGEAKSGRSSSKRRKRGVVLTHQGWQKLQATKLEHEDQSGRRYTLEVMSELTTLSVDTLMKIFACESGVDKQSLKCCFAAFALNLDPQDFTHPQESGSLYATTTIPNPIVHILPYVERPPLELTCYEALQQAGSLIRVKAPRLMGKTALMTRVLGELAQLGYRTVHLSFELADRKIHFNHLDKFLRWFCVNLSRELRIPHQLDEYWDEEDLGSKVSCTTYLEDYLLDQSQDPLVIALDDVDILFPYPDIYEDFFGLLRSWYEKARSRPLWQRLRLVIIHATDVYSQLNINQSPFNVGLPIELPEFTLEQVRDLAEQFQLQSSHQLAAADLGHLLAMVGGHPYLIQLTFTYLRNQPERRLDDLLQEAVTDTGIFSSHLREQWLKLDPQPTLVDSLHQVVRSEQPVKLDPLASYQLQRLGLVRMVGHYAEPRCQLYRDYFRERL